MMIGERCADLIKADRAGTGALEDKELTTSLA